MKKIISSLLILLMMISVFAIAACGNNNDNQNDNQIDEEIENPYIPEYNTVIYDNVGEWINEDFKSENPVTGWPLINENNLPQTRTFIVVDEETFSDMFIDDFSEFEVDFNTEMVIVYTNFVIIASPAKITNMEMSDNNLTIYYKFVNATGGTSVVSPYQRWFAVKLDKLDISTAIFVKQ